MRHARRTSAAVFALLLSLSFPRIAASQYFFNGTLPQLPDSSSALDIREINFPIVTTDMRSGGMGLTSVADSLALNAVQINPALLANRHGVGGSFMAYGATPSKTIDAINFLSENDEEFISGTTAREIYQRLQTYNPNDPGSAAALAEDIRLLLEVPQAMVDKLVGNPDTPNQNGANLNANLQIEIGQFAASLQAYGQTGFAINLGSVYRDLYDILQTTDFTDTAQVVEAIVRLQGITDFLIDPVTGEVSPLALPALYAVSYADLVGTVGYGFNVAPNVDIGVNLKVINRRFSYDRLGVSDAEDIAQGFLSDLETGTTGVTADLGLLLRPDPMVEIGLSLQNIIPVQTIESSYRYRFTQTRVIYQRDGNGNFVVNVNGDTALVATVQNVDVFGPAKLQLPFVASSGVIVHVLDDLDFTFEWVDMFAQQEFRFDSYAERFRLGAEYRFHFPGNFFSVPLRVGLAEASPTFGLGADFAGFVQLDFASYVGNLTKERTYGVQLRVAW